MRVVSPSRSSGTLKSVRTRIRLPSSDPSAASRSSRVGSSDTDYFFLREPSFLPAYSMKSTIRLE